MTEENYGYRTSQLMLRNSFRGDGKWEIPIIPKFQIRDGDFDDLLLYGRKQNPLIRCLLQRS